jgi:7-carboxy-7-deazaguanine synthase
MLPVYETFHSWQGEGCHLGRSAFFIRLFGCPVHCPWCDSAGTWHPNHVPKHITKVNPEELAESAAVVKPECVIITGGEPAIHDLGPLTAALKERGLPVHLETSGGFALKGEFSWITVSPKRQKLPVAETLAQADEFKLIVETPECIRFWEETVGSYFRGKPVWLHPEWSHREDPDVLAAITQWVKLHGSPYRAGWQVHKLYRADALDPRARPDASLV